MSSTDMVEHSMDKIADRVRAAGIIAIVRGDYSMSQLEMIAGALTEGGVRALEVTLNSTQALRGIEQLRRGAGEDLLIGAGTVRTVADVDRALQAGAQFLVSPNFDPDGVERSLKAGVLHLPGVCTPTEAQRAFAAGCRMVKLFPAAALGPSYLKALRAPLDDIAFVPTGGINADNIEGYVQAGAAALGVGSALITGAGQGPTDVTERAEQLTSALLRARET